MKIKKIFERITGIESLKEIIEHQQKIIEKQDTYYTELFHNNCYVANLQRECNGKNSIIDELKEQIAAKNEEIRKVEKSLEGTIDQQYSEIQKLKTQLAHATDYEGKFYVFNSLKDKPRKVYENYAAALTDAKAVSKLTNGQKILVLKIVSGVQISEKIEDYSIMPEDEIPF